MTATVVFELAIDRPAPGARDAARSLHRQLRQAIADGRLPPGARLPPTRLSLECFGVSRNTLAEVYERLLDDALIVARQGAGTFVAPFRERARRPEAQASTPAVKRQLNPVWQGDALRAAIGFWSDPAEEFHPPIAVDFRPAQVDPRQFPHATFRRVMTQQLRALDRRPPTARGPAGNRGNRGLRAAIAHHIALTRAVSCDPEDILITAGAQQAFDLLARVLVIPGQTVVAVEDPGYPPMRAAFAAAGARLAPVPIDEEGLRVDAIPEAARVVCLCPSHQFPVGVTMSAERRAQLLAFASGTGAVIVEDDYDGEFRLDDDPLPALRAADRDEAVCYIGTFSKCMLPSLRLGFLIAPPWLRPAVTAAKNCADWHCPTATQAGVAAFILEGHLTRHIRRMREIYAERKRHLCHRLDVDFGGLLEAVPSNYGMHVGAFAAEGVDVERLCARVRAEGVALHGFSRYHAAGPTSHGVIFGLGTVDEAAIDRGLHALRRAADERLR